MALENNKIEQPEQTEGENEKVENKTESTNKIEAQHKIIADIKKEEEEERKKDGDPDDFLEKALR